MIIMHLFVLSINQISEINHSSLVYSQPCTHYMPKPQKISCTIPETD